MATVENATVTLTINGRELTVPRGLSLVEAAAEGGVEIPVFCYEPRLGDGIGACRMCLVEIEGMPKLQTACTTRVADGMVVDSRSERAREGQDGVLEFLLINHPLDCPVCDKGGECPLQDLTFRYGPGVTRMSLPKRTHDKPVAVSPLITLDRERCILCWRCVRFSEEVAGDMLLVAENRGANSLIATFEGRPYDSEFSGNVTELCPVGALTSTTYRFRGRPWEIQNVPTVCGRCAVGCNTYASIREGAVARVLSRNHPDVDEGWLCDKGRYTIAHLAAGDRNRSTLIRGGRGLEPVSTGDGLDHVADRLRATVEKFGHGSVAVVASGEQTNEEAHAWARILETGLRGGPSVCGPEGGAGWESLVPYAASLADLATSPAIVIAGDADVAHRAPVVELRVRRAHAAGARVVTVGVGATRVDTIRGVEHVDAAPGGAHLHLLAAASASGPINDALATEGSVLIWSGRMSPAAAGVIAHVCHTLGCSLLATPAAANELGCTAAGLGDSSPEQVLAGVEAGEIRALVLLGSDPVGDWPAGDRWRAALGRCFFALQVSAFQNDSSGQVTTIVPACDVLESEGTLTNLEGRTQRVRPAAAPPAGVNDGYLWAAELAGRLGVELPADASGAFAELAAARPSFAGLTLAGVGERAALPERSARPADPPPQPRVAAGGEPQAELVAVGYRQLMSGAAVDRTPQLHFQRRSGIELSVADAERIGVATGDPVRVVTEGREHTGPAQVRRGLRAGVVRLAARVPFVLPAAVEAVEVGGAGDA
ncbi:MAG TPA: 2Fe-2S iron-sulfur cluster-binding protein [Gaiellales bacterium]|nr:2Fe-2S iron-sulfur cluster-binding protein [Gaiellales bacterium]